ncbi:MAG TPA: hypothetical protein VGG33_07085 [Polyangia bacterium]
MTITSLVRFTAPLALLLAGSARPVLAQTPGDPCGADVETFCKDVPAPGGGRFRCLKKHEKELSAACKQHVADMAARGQGIHDACWEDVDRLCKDTRGRGRILKCLKAHEGELSEPCKAALAPAKK